MNNNKKIWVTSDTHYGHLNIVGKSVSNWDRDYRDFETLDDMNSTIVKSINKYVSHDDILYHLGDWSFGGVDNIKKFRGQINCHNIHLILGNHDQHIDKDRFGYSNLFSSIKSVDYINYDFYKFFLSHYSHRVWNGSHKGVIHLYGHSHDSLDRNNQQWGKSMDVGIDSSYRINGEYRPFSIDEIINIMDKREIKYIDCHTKNVL